jgi:hypothetical protein
MLILILILAIGLAAVAHRYLQMCAPSNAILRSVGRAQPRIRVAADLLLLSAGLFVGAYVLTDWVATGGPGWVNCLVLIAVWNLFKFTWMVLLILLRCTARKLTLNAKPSGG